MFVKFAVAASIAALALVPASAAVVISVESPGITSTSANGIFAVETFDAATPAFQASLNETIGAVSFSYSGVDVRPADIFGGVGGSNYAATYNGLNFSPYDASAGTYTLYVASAGGPVNFFGAYFTAQDFNNQITFFKNGNAITTFTPAVVLNAIAGVPEYTTSGLVNVYVNIFFTAGDTYDQVLFDAAGNGTGFESDNHTVGSFIPPITGTIVGGTVPEPATWAMFVVGFGLVGFATRRKAVAAA